MKIDAVGKLLLQRINGLLAARPDISRADFGTAIHRGHSWISEFFSQGRTTNDLRLVLKMARFFRVPVGYLLNDGEANHDAETLTLLGAWRDLSRPQDRAAVLQLAVTLRPGATDTTESNPARVDVTAPEPRTSSRGNDGPRKKAR